MILGSLESLKRYAQLNSHFSKVLDYLARTDLTLVPKGRNEIDGDNVYVLSVPEAQARPASEALLEAHRRYIDIQVILDGVESMGWAPLEGCSRVDKLYSHENDIEFYGDPATAWFTVHPGQFAIFFPHDAHAPLVGHGKIRKLIFKVLAE